MAQAAAPRTALVRRARRINRELARLYPDARNELTFTTAFGKPALVVDTHVARLARWFGWTVQTGPDKIEHDVAALLPPREWTAATHRLIWHGRVCHARTPACGVCGIARLCPSFGEGPADEATARKLVKTGPFS